MAKSGISVVRSYQVLNYILPLAWVKGIQEYFPGIQSPIGGLEIEQIAEQIQNRAEFVQSEEKHINYQEFPV